MKVTKIGVDWSRTINMGDFYSIRPGIFLEAELEDGEDVAEATKALAEQAKSLCAIQAVDMAQETETIKRVGILDYVNTLFDSE